MHSFPREYFEGIYSDIQHFYRDEFANFIVKPRIMRALHTMTMAMMWILNVVSNSINQGKNKQKEWEFKSTACLPILPNLAHIPSSLTNNNPMAQRERERESRNACGNWWEWRKPFIGNAYP
jgi:hypothetical protein